MAVDPVAKSVVDAVLRQGMGVNATARAFDVSSGWVSKMTQRYLVGGYENLAPRSRAPKTSPNRTCVEVESRIIEIHKSLADLGTDCGAQTIHYHLGLEFEKVPSVSTIQRILKRRGFVRTEPKKRPKSSYLRFEAELPNETWQADITHWKLADDTQVDILDFIDDYSRTIVAADVRPTTKARDVVETFNKAGAFWGYPASVLTDNGAVFVGRRGDQRVSFQTRLAKLGVDSKNSRPYHPQTQGKIERFHQTLKNHLATRPVPETIEELQNQINVFVKYYNETRPHRARGRNHHCRLMNPNQKQLREPRPQNAM